MSKTEKFVTLENLGYYHKSLIDMLSKQSKLMPTNICPNCCSVLEPDNTCSYCGLKYKLVVDKGE